MKIVLMGMCLHPHYNPSLNKEIDNLKADFMDVFAGMEYLEKWICVMDDARTILEEDNEKAPAVRSKLMGNIAKYCWECTVSFIKGTAQTAPPQDPISWLPKELRQKDFEQAAGFVFDFQSAFACNPAWDISPSVICVEKRLFRRLIEQIERKIPGKVKFANNYEQNVYDEEVFLVIEDAVCYFRQRAWMLWMQSFFSNMIKEKLEEENVKNDVLYLVLMPEFCFLDYPVDANSAKAFVFRALNDEWNDPDGIEWAFRKENIVLLTFRQLTGRYKNLLLLPGTVVWKAMDLEKRIFYNTLMVYYQGNVIKVWDKQLVSGVDGICRIDKYKHIMSEDTPSGTGFASWLTAGFLDSLETRDRNASYGPVFEIEACGRRIVFGVQICLDVSRPDYFSFNSVTGEIDYQIILACGEDIGGILLEKNTQIMAKSGVFYCDSAISFCMHQNMIFYCDLTDSLVADLSDPPTREEKNKVYDFLEKIIATFNKDHASADRPFLYRWPEEITVKD